MFTSMVQKPSVECRAGRSGCPLPPALHPVRVQPKSPRRLNQVLKIAMSSVRTLDTGYRGGIYFGPVDFLFLGRESVRPLDLRSSSTVRTC
jgi:hypothetical protein